MTERESPRAKPDLTRERNRQRSRSMVSAIISAFAASLKGEARKRGGFLTLPDLDELDEAFREKAAELTEVFEQAFNEALREQEELKWQQIKRPAFDRLMVKRFDAMFMRRDKEGHIHGSFSRRILPGFFLALNMLLGPDKLEELQNRSDEAFARVMKGITPVDWDLLDQDRDIRDVVLEAELAIAWQFTDTQKRSEWFIQLVNANLAPAPDSAPEVEAQWELDHRNFLKLISALLQDLHIVTGDAQEWKRLRQRFPDAKREELVIVLDRLR